jgi:hypothetical protein
MFCIETIKRKNQHGIIDFVANITLGVRGSWYFS